MIRSLLAASALLVSATVAAEITFQDVTDFAGPFHTGSSWGASWGDVNGDGRPDLYASNHQMRGSLWRNNGDGTFTDVILTVDRLRVLTGGTSQDSHAGTWADFDNDGDQDLLSVRSSTGGRGQLFINSDGIFTREVGVEMGLRSFTGGRMGSWFDYNNDGSLDIAAMAAGYAQILRRGTTSFSNTTSSVGMSNKCLHDNFAQLLDITDDGRPELLCGAVATFPEKVFDTSTSVFRDLTAMIGQDALVPDVALADFDNNLKIDIFKLRGRIRPSEVLLVSPERLESYIPVSSDSSDKGFSFAASSPITVTDFSYARENVKEDIVIYAGTGRWSPTTLPFTLDPADASNWGISSTRNDPGLYIGFDRATQRWVARVSAASADSRAAYFAIEGSALADIQPLDFTGSDYPQAPRLVLNKGTQFESVGNVGIDEVWCKSVAAGDFDNDMDVDLYLACGSSLINLANRLFENLGDGTFAEVTEANGAAGIQGAGLESKVGASESAVTADYDLDGYLDLFVTNGPLLTPLLAGGPDQLFRNTSSGNHWIQLDLEGTTSNRNAIGAKVYAYANGKAQVREQNGGYHRWSQDQTRIHFGLANNTSVDLTVEWPSGQVDQYHGVASNSVYHVTEGGAIEPVTPEPVPPFPAPQVGDECGVPAYTRSLDQGLFLWKDCTTQQWYFRAGSGGSTTAVKFAGQFVSSDAFTSVTQYSIEAADVLDKTDPKKLVFSLASVGAGDDGFQFGTTGASTCLYVSVPADVRLLLGAKTLPVALPFNLATRSSTGCSTVGITLSDVTVDETAASARFILQLSEPSTNSISVQYITRDRTATGGADYTATLTPIAVLFPPGTTSQTIVIPILDDSLREETESFEVSLTNATNATIARAIGIATITDNDLSPCGAPVYNRATEQGVFLWKDCTSGTWSARMSPGGSNLTYQGSVSAGARFQSVTGFSIETKDTLDFTTDPARIDFALAVAGTSQDGFDFRVATDAGVCFRLDAPATTNLYIGAARRPLTSPFDLSTLGECGVAPVPRVSVDNVAVTEGAADGAATLTVLLSEPTWTTVTLDYTTLDGSAAAGSDYTPISGTLSFAPGETSKTINLPIVNDAVTETAEHFTVSLSNAVNAVIETTAATVTIQDDDTIVTVFSDGCETASDWVANPNRTDRATTGRWEIGDPEATSSSGVPLQPETAHGGLKALVTGAAAGANPPGSDDIDDGVTSVRSRNIVLPSTGTLTLDLSYFFAHLNNASSADFLRVTIQGASSSRVLLQQLGSATNRAGVWTGFSTNIADFAGQTVYLLIEAADHGDASLIEAGVDDLSITRQ